MLGAEQWGLDTLQQEVVDSLTSFKNDILILAHFILGGAANE